VGGFTGSVYLYDVQSGELLRTIKTSEHSLKGDYISIGIRSLAFSPDSQFLVTGTDAPSMAPGTDGKLHPIPITDSVGVWKVSDGTSVAANKGDLSPVPRIKWSPDGKYIAAVSADRTVRIWSANHLQGDSGVAISYQALSVAFSPDSKYLAAAGHNDVKIFAISP